MNHDPDNLETIDALRSEISALRAEVESLRVFKENWDYLIESLKSVSSHADRTDSATVEALLDKARESSDLRVAVKVLASECAGWRKWESECSAMAALRPAESPELNETADNSWIRASAELVNYTDANPIARAAIEAARKGTDQ